MTNVWLFDKEHRRINSGSSAADNDDDGLSVVWIFLQEHRIKNSGSVDDFDDADSAWASTSSLDFCCQNIDIGTISILQWYLASSSDKSDCLL